MSAYSDVRVEGFKAPEVIVEPPVDPRVLTWASAWRALRAKLLPRVEHEAKRDEMLAWAAARGRDEKDRCLAGLLRSESYYDPVAADDLALIAGFPFEGPR